MLSAAFDQTYCALCGRMFPYSSLPVQVSVGRLEKPWVCALNDEAECRGRAIEIMRAYEKMKETL